MNEDSRSYDTLKKVDNLLAELIEHSISHKDCCLSKILGKVPVLQTTNLTQNRTGDSTNDR